MSPGPSIRPPYPVRTGPERLPATTLPRMPARPDDPAAPDDPAVRRRGRVTVGYWLAAGAVYAGLGALYPPAFLLGFQESLAFVFVVTLLAPRIVRLIAR